MSEYQYYEFQAIDRPLDARAMAALRSLTSRAEITPSSLINAYHYGDFKGDPDKLMDRYFDAHLYLANWGTRRLMLRLPAACLPLDEVKPYVVPGALEARATREHVILDFQSDTEEGGDYEEGAGWLASLLPLRWDLLHGDRRCLYLGWLGAIEWGELGDDSSEPPVPLGLQQLSAPLQRLAEFLRLDADLVQAAGAGSAGAPPCGPESKELASWVAQLPVAEKDRLLLQVMEGENTFLGPELLRRFHEDRARRRDRAAPREGAEPPRRTVGQLMEVRNRLAHEKQLEAKRQQAERARKAAQARARHLDTLVGHEEELWQQVEQAIEAKQTKEYDRAVKLLKDLRDLARHTGTTSEMMRRVRDLRERYRKRSALMRLLDRAVL